MSTKTTANQTQAPERFYIKANGLYRTRTGDHSPRRQDAKTYGNLATARIYAAATANIGQVFSTRTETLVK